MTRTLARAGARVGAALVLAAVLALVLAPSALAHPGHDAATAWGGFAHPFCGLDHVLAMTAVGLLAAQRRGRGALLVPLAFLAAMAVGAVLARAGVGLPGVEPVILASGIVLGTLVAASWRLSMPAAATIVGVFAIAHGHAHAAEAGSGGAVAHGAGFLLGTAALHAVGLGVGVALRGTGRAGVVRALGAAVALVGVAAVVAAVVVARTTGAAAG